MEAKEVKNPMIPAINPAECTDCGSCEAVCPEVFSRDETGRLRVNELPEYPESCVREAINMCPEDCIYWEPC